MRKRFKTLSAWSFVLAMVIFTLSYLLYHYVTPEGTITLVFQEEAGKPFLVAMLTILGVQFLFGSIMSLMIAKIFCLDNQTRPSDERC